VTFLLFEGSIALGVILVLADFVSGWGVIAVPVTVAVMVKINDVIAGGLGRPLAVAQLRAPRRPEGVAVGRSRVPPSHREASRPTMATAGGRPRPEGVEAPTRASAKVVARGTAAVRPAPDRRAPATRAEPVGAEGVRPDGADRRSRGNTGRFSG
jgi:hypothetical protein